MPRVPPWHRQRRGHLGAGGEQRFAPLKVLDHQVYGPVQNGRGEPVKLGLGAETGEVELGGDTSHGFAPFVFGGWGAR